MIESTQMNSGRPPLCLGAVSLSDAKQAIAF